MSAPNTQRDLALTAALEIGAFVHLTFSSGKVEQGWLHLHDGAIRCCAEAERRFCDIRRQEIADALYQGFTRMYPPMDTASLIRIDAAIVASGRYVPLWHDADHVERNHVIEREDLACCKGG